MSEKVGYAAVTKGNAAPMFCIDCGEDTNREVEPLTEERMGNFDSAECCICDTIFYSTSDGYRLSENVILMNGIIDTALYKANRYHHHEYDHLRDDALEEIKKVRDLADELLERENYERR